MTDSSGEEVSTLRVPDAGRFILTCDRSTPGKADDETVRRTKRRPVEVSRP